MVGCHRLRARKNLTSCPGSVDPLQIEEDHELQQDIDDLLVIKRASPERGLSPQIAPIQRFVERELQRLESIKPIRSDRKQIEPQLSALFRSVLKETWDENQKLNQPDQHRRHRMPAPIARPDLIYEYPAHLRAQVEAAPRAPGVYIFYAEGDVIPLYIGKSIDIRSRLLSHLRTPAEARMLLQAQRIEYRQTAGEIGALLLESRLIKELQPLKNKRLRRQQRLCSLRIRDGVLEIIDTTEISHGTQLYGLFRNRRMATQALMLIADEHRLCHSLLGLEKTMGRGCFRAQIGKCAGACKGEESNEAHTKRLLNALERWAVHHWPYPGAIALHEQHGEFEEYHVVESWRYIGTYASETEARLAPRLAGQAFDADCYKILVRPVLLESTTIILLT